MRRRAGLVPTALALVVTAAGCGHARVAGPTLRPRWRWSAPSPASVGMPAADAVGVAATYGHRALVLLDGAGNLRWQVEHVGVRDVAPRFVGPLVLVATDDGLAAFGRGDGHRLWEASLGDRASTPTVVGGRAVVTLWGGALVAVDLLDGHQAWRQPLPGPALGPPAGDAGVVVATWETEGGHGGMVAVDADGRVQWSVSLPGGGVGGPAAAAGVAVAVAGDSQAHGVDVTTGRERWHAATGGAGSPEVPPLVVGPDVLVADRLGGLTTLRAATGATTGHVESDGVDIRGGPAGPGPGGWYALPLDEGRLQLVRGRQRRVVPSGSGGRIAGVAVGPRRVLVVAGREAVGNGLDAWAGW